MKNFTIIGAFALVGSLLLITSCKETNPTFIDITGTGTIKGIVEVNSDQIETDDDFERASGANVRISWNTSSLGVISDGDSRTESITVTTDTNGQFSVEVPTTENGVNFTVDFDEFEITDFSYNDGTSDIVNTTAIFDEDSYSVSVKTGEIKNRNHNYGSSPFYIED